MNCFLVHIEGCNSVPNCLLKGVVWYMNILFGFNPLVSREKSRCKLEFGREVNKASSRIVRTPDQFNLNEVH